MRRLCELKKVVHYVIDGDHSQKPIVLVQVDVLTLI